MVYVWHDPCNLIGQELTHMPKCPHCRHSFRVMDDEEYPPMHDCPHCGYGPRDDDTPEEPEPTCNYCGEPLPAGETDYCSALCSNYAIQDSEEN